MRHVTRPVLGILGGMGSLATADFYRRVVERTPAGSDRAHLPVVMRADPAVPDRTAALLGEGPSPVPALVEGARRLQRAGASCIAVPCDTAHAYVERLSRATDAEVLDMIGAALEAAAACRAPGTERVGVLATRGTRLAGLYERTGARLGLDVVHVPASVQERYVDAATALPEDRVDAASVGRALEPFTGHHMAKSVLETAVLDALPGFTLPGDTSGSHRYFARDVTEPFVLTEGHLDVPTGPGLGIEPLPDVLKEVTTSTDVDRAAASAQQVRLAEEALSVRERQRGRVSGSGDAVTGRSPRCDRRDHGSSRSVCPRAGPRGR
ncbi:amino acid racemase [Streptomyces sp. NPDC000963]